jgi:insertion element IS1 protein InsB
VAYVVGSRADDAFLELKALLGPCGVTRYYSDKWGAYRRHLPAEQHTVSKRYVQKIERKHLTLRTRLKRLARQTLCFSRSIEMHNLVIGLFINRYEFGHEA